MCFDLPCGDVALAMFCAPATQPTPNPTHTFLKEEKRRPGQTPSAEDFKHEFCQPMKVLEKWVKFLGRHFGSVATISKGLERSLRCLLFRFGWGGNGFSIGSAILT